MAFRNGAAGVCVAVLAIMGTVLAGFAMAVETTEERVTSWDYVTDISGLFETTQEPQFIAYDPGENWTGWTMGGTATAGIAYTSTYQASKYPVRQDAEETGNGTAVLDDVLVKNADGTWVVLESAGVATNGAVSGINAINNRVFISDDSTSRYGANENKIVKPYNTPLTDALEMITDDYGILRIEGWSTEDDGPRIAFSYRQQWQQVYIPTLLVDEAACILAYSDVTAVAYIEYHAADGVVYAYDSNGSKVWSAPYGDVVVSIALEYYDGSTITGIGEGLGTCESLTNTLVYTCYEVPPTIYMDIDDGVSVTGTPTWSNGYRVGSMDIVFHAPGSNSYANTLTMDLLDVNGNDTGEDLEITVRYAGRTMYVDIGGETYLLGSWKSFVLRLDFLDGVYEAIPISLFGFTSFTDFEALEDSAITLGTHADGRTITSIAWQAATSLEVGVVSTDVYMDTYGYVLVDPSLDIQAVFPEMDSIRINFYAFATYGTTITINGVTYKVDADTAMINIPGENEEGTIVDKWYELANLFVSYDGGRVSVTFSDGETRDLGTIETWVISMAGTWYFTTGLWEGTTSMEKIYEWNFEHFLWGSTGTMVVFIGLTVVIAAIMARTQGMKALDWIVVVGAIGVVLAMLGMWSY